MWGVTQAIESNDHSQETAVRGNMEHLFWRKETETNLEFSEH